MRALRAGVLPDPGGHGEDRLVPGPYELELLLRVFEDVGAQHVLTGGGKVTSEGVLHARIRASISAEKIRKMKARHKRKQEDIAKDGRWGVGSVSSATPSSTGRATGSVQLRARPGDQGGGGGAAVQRRAGSSKGRRPRASRKSGTPTG